MVDSYWLMDGQRGRNADVSATRRAPQNRRTPKPGGSSHGMLHFVPRICYNGPMDDTSGTASQQVDERPHNFYTPGLWSWIAFFILVLYPLSIGPAVHLHNAVPPLRKPIETFYTPLVYAARHSRAIDSFFRWYIQRVWHAK